MDGTCAGLLGSMDRAAFVVAVERAERDASEANRTHAYLAAWAERLLPYLDADPAMTVADALEHYRRANTRPNERTPP